MKREVSTFSSLVGLVLSVVGLFLPWTKEEWIPGAMGLSSDYLLGIELAVGQIALIACIFVSILLIFYVIRRQGYSLVFALFGGLFTMFCSLLWMVDPGALILSRFPVYYTVLYGTYVTFIGSVLISASATLALRSYKFVPKSSNQATTPSDT
ncbi:MAG TPA: hypothetical protein VIH48_02925 [Candidatus Bathyarchaeia archaeon]